MSLRDRAELAFFELEAVALMVAADLPPCSGPARLVEARWAAARGLLLEILQEGDATPGHLKPGPWLDEPLAEIAHIGAMVRRHGWRVHVPGVLVRVGGGARG
jgi:hypothetical protein